MFAVFIYLTGFIPVVKAWYSAFLTESQHEIAPAVEEDFASHPMAGIARWSLMLLPNRGADAESPGVTEASESPLLRHMDGDLFCTCARDSCLLGVCKNAGTQRLLEIVSRLFTTNFLGIAIVWTSLVTYASLTFTTWWSASFAALYLPFSFFAHFMAVVPHEAATVASIQLATRMQHRVVLLALRDLLSRYRDAISLGTDAGPLQALRGPEPEYYMRVNAALVDSWKQRRPGVSEPRFFILVVSVSIVGFVTNVAAGGCVVGWVPVSLLILLNFLVVDMVVLGYANEQISTVTNLYRAAIQDTRELLATAESGPSPAPAAVSAALRNHSAVLESYLAADRHRARVFGIAVGHNVTRGVLVTAFTAALGLWTLLRGAGVFFTMDIACPRT
ncbi:hypothetical protein DFJ74DRAFT_672988 [Hyaloraphidium curvatum]|nr:hypothetical protein DFJ74DRAFT_672988 [Hyaloraphidium curvatum]